MFEEHALDPAAHDRAGFDCGVSALNEYLQRLADQHRRKSISTPYVLVESASPRAILGYYTLSAAELDAASLEKRVRKKLPRYPIPCFRMGRLACRADRRGQGLGRLLVGCAVDRCLQARKQVAAYALIVDAKDANARAFYEHYGFVPMQDRPMAQHMLVYNRYI